MTMIKTKEIIKKNVGLEKEPVYKYEIRYKFTDTETGEVRLEVQGTFSLAEIAKKENECDEVRLDWKSNSEIAKTM